MLRIVTDYPRLKEGKKKKSFVQKRTGNQFSGKAEMILCLD